MIRIAIVEDEKKSADLMRKYISQYSAKTGLHFSCDWFEGGLQFINDYKPLYDIVFMDIKMPHYDGIEAAKELRKHDQSVALIFVTNMMQYAIKGYEVNALDFMLKPVRYYDFEMKLIKAVDYIRKHQDTSITIDVKDMKKKIPLRDLYYVEVDNHTLIFHTADGKFSTYGQLKNIEESLHKMNFGKCNSYSIVNLKHVMEVHTTHIVVANQEIPISRRRKAAFMEQLTDYYGAEI